MAGAGGPLRLREWLVAQIESGSYAGLRWEDAGKTLFRIPWKHAAKQGYQVRQDAALFRGRVYWRGPLAPHRAQPNKLERERTCQLLDTRRFLAELRAHLQDGCPEPEYQIRLCFGEEYPGPPDQPEERLIMAHKE
ncbi:hypothetical protein E5288_WYG004238 [Bos mutus]|uniref:IRF tryptophan pentad repeat domain-containing protein n=1 Tax=Bos mutus TaxID=72004 RepID=A0A6B0R7R6_9CETA|nr:hypothetical protein [Bos mutus]